MSSEGSGQHYRLHAFHVGCWVLGLIAFAELVAVGVALGLNRQQAGQPTVVERVEYVTVPGVAETRGVVPVEPVKPEVTLTPLVDIPDYEPPVVNPTEPTPLPTPAIADPVVERLVREAQAARVAGDVKAAIAKLEDAAERTPDDPNVLYQFAEIFESVGVHDRAEDYYQRVFELGTLKAGGLHKLASHKLAHGFLMEQKMEGKMALGRVRQFFDKRVKDGEMVILTIPVLAAPGQGIDPESVRVSVSFYDKLEGEVVQASVANTPETKWVSSPVDWSGGAGEELLQVSYYIPTGDVQELHLFGQRTYFGQVVELSFDGEVLDSQAWPRILARKVNVRDQDPLFIPDEFLPEEFNPENPLLPPLPRR